MEIPRKKHQSGKSFALRHAEADAREVRCQIASLSEEACKQRGLFAERVPFFGILPDQVREVSFFECLEKIELYCSKKNNNEKSFSELRFCEMIVLVLAFLDFSDRLQHDVFVNANNDMS